MLSCIWWRIDLVQVISTVERIVSKPTFDKLVLTRHWHWQMTRPKEEYHNISSDDIFTSVLLVICCVINSEHIRQNSFFNVFSKNRHMHNEPFILLSWSETILFEHVIILFDEKDAYVKEKNWNYLFKCRCISPKVKFNDGEIYTRLLMFLWCSEEFAFVVIFSIVFKVEYRPTND
jgi:hypothetical protein